MRPHNHSIQNFLHFVWIFVYMLCRQWKEEENLLSSTAKKQVKNRRRNPLMVYFPFLSVYTNTHTDVRFLHIHFANFFSSTIYDDILFLGKACISLNSLIIKVTHVHCWKKGGVEEEGREREKRRNEGRKGEREEENKRKKITLL